MAVELLHCCVCPKQPRFSDTSHLLTHVSSKGHLSYLHKLQVRSHQETSASRQLSLYNDWFTEHDVAHLLSQRMQLKERKQAKRRSDNKRRCDSTTPRPQTKSDSGLLSNAQQLSTTAAIGYTAVGPNQQDHIAYTLGYLDVNETCFAPVQQARFGPDAADYLDDEFFWYKEEETRNEILSPTACEPEHVMPELAKLKGIIWPGMDMFDSADEETQRKRNQRKDGSVLQKMQAMSELIEPMETVCSPGGTVKKKRHMDDLETDSPVEGECQLIRQSLKRVRKPLAVVSRNTHAANFGNTRAARRSFKAGSTPTRDKRLVTGSQRNVRRQFPVHRDDDLCGRSDFAALAEVSSGLGADPSHEQNFDPFFDESQVDGLKSFESQHLSWLPLAAHDDRFYDPFKEYRSTQLASAIYSDCSIGKENVNPLSWQKTPGMTVPELDLTSNGIAHQVDDGFGALAEVYAFTQKPLTNITPNRTAINTTPPHRTSHPYQPVEAKTPLFC